MSAAPRPDGRLASPVAVAAYNPWIIAFTVTLATFKDYVGKIESAAAERKDAEEELSNYQKRGPRP